MLKEKLTEALENRKNDVNSYVWKFAKKDNKEDIKLMDATEDQLQDFYNHCQSMLYSVDKKYPGRYTLLETISLYRYKCTVELLLRQLENGSLLSDGRGYPRHLLYQDIMDLVNSQNLTKEQLKELAISAIPDFATLPRDYERISINDVLNACIDKLGSLSFKHITYSFIYGLGVYPTSEENKALVEKDENGKKRDKIEVLKERLYINKNEDIKIKPSGLSVAELKTMTEMKAISKFTPKKYSDLTISELLVLRNKVLFRLEQKVKDETEIWEQKIAQILKVAETRGIAIRTANL